MLSRLESGLSFHEALECLGYPVDLAKHIAEEAAQVTIVKCSAPGEPGASYFVEHLLAMKEIILKRRYVETQVHKRIDQTFDFLSTDCWRVGFFKSLCFAVNALISPSKSIAVVATVRNEGPFIIEWIAHHQAIGINYFFIYTNDNTDGSLHLLRILADAGVIFLIENDVAKVANPQVKAYEHSLYFNENCRSFSWLIYLDADELLVPASHYDFRINNLLSDLESRFSEDHRPSSISINWMWIGSDGQIFRDRERRLAERFVVGATTSLFVKSIVNPSAVISMRGVHKPILRCGHFGVNTAFQLIDMVEHSSPFVFDGGEIRHYWNKSFEEFLIKQARGVDRNIWERDINLFFEWDVTAATGSRRPFPDVVARRTDCCIAAMRTIAGVSDVERGIEEAYATLARKAVQNVDLKAFYLLSRERFELRTLLQQPPLVVEDIASPSKLLMDISQAHNRLRQSLKNASNSDVRNESIAVTSQKTVGFTS